MTSFSAAQATIAAMITPALLILASGSLIATALVRLARVVDRVRRLAESGLVFDAADLRRLEQRALLAERAVGRFFAAIVCFVVAGFLVGVDRVTGDRFAWLPVAVTTLGMLLIVVGSGDMLQECRLGVAQIRAEIAGAGAALTTRA